MKNFIFMSIFLFGTVLTTAQTPFRLDTIYANDQKNVALFFPEPIRQGITGSENFVFTYNREKGQFFGLLQAKPGKESNLLVVGKNGSVFSYIVKYRKKLDRLNYFIPKSKSIGNEKPIALDSTTIVKREDTIDNRTYYYNKFCSYLIGRKQRIGRLKKRNEGIVLRIENIVFDKEELYFVIQVENKSSLDYDLKYLKLSVETRKRAKRSLYNGFIKNRFLNIIYPQK